MNKYVIACLSFFAGAASGFIVGYYMNQEQKNEVDPVKELKENNKVKSEKPQTESNEKIDISTLKPREVNTDGPKINYNKVEASVEEVKIALDICNDSGYKTGAEEFAEEKPDDIEDMHLDEEYVEPDSIDADDSEEEDFFEDEAINDYKKRNKGKINILPEGDLEYSWGRDVGNDPMEPEVIYDEAELYYFTKDHKISDDDGHDITDKEVEYVGSKPREFGWFSNDKEEIYIRNHPKETDFRLNKVNSSFEEYWY